MNQVHLLCDNESAIKIAYNPWEYFRTKHIEKTNEQLVDIFAKPLDEKRFQELRSELNIIDF
jgi:hypothetical protein